MCCITAGEGDLYLKVGDDSKTGINVIILPSTWAESSDISSPSTTYLLECATFPFGGEWILGGRGGGAVSGP